MKAKQTVMTHEEAWRIYQANGGRGIPPRDQVHSVAEAQAEISVEAGMQEVVDFVNNHLPKTLSNYVGFWHQWQDKLKEELKNG